MIKQEQIGKHEFTVVEFGVGDIALVQIDEEGTKGRTLLIAQDVPKPLEKWESKPDIIAEAQNSDDIKFEVKPIILRFTRSESISQLMKSLQEMYDSLNLEETK